MKKVFIDGSAGTTGLRIKDRLSGREDISLITLSESERKDLSFRKRAINESDVTFLCLPDDAAIEAVSLVENENTVIIDTSTAHRTNADFAYGFPELDLSFEEKIVSSKRIAVPGCHAGGFIALVYPLIKAGIIPEDAGLVCHSITGYSGGGKKMIAEYESEERSSLLSAPRQYALTQKHKHLKEMCGITGLQKTPIFMPVVSDFYSGMTVTVPLFADEIKGSAEDIREIYKNKYTSPIVYYLEEATSDGFVSGLSQGKKDSMTISVAGNDERILLIAQYDNLGKGASGAAVECMNLVLGLDRCQGLEL